jgi:hypothetical protein
MLETQQPLFTRRTLWAACGLTLLFVALLFVGGRPWWCKYGIGFWANAWTHCTSQHFLDPYALTHVLHGILFYWLLRPLAAANVSLHWRVFGAFALEVVWELIENSPWVIERYRQDTAALDYTGDSILNALGDLVATMLGIAFAARLSWKASAAFFVAAELLLLFTVRDNLTLNVLMLFWPLEAVKEWQFAGIAALLATAWNRI